MDERKLGRALGTIRRTLRGADPKHSIACESCGTRTIRDGQFAHKADCAALTAEMELMDFVEGFGRELAKAKGE